MDSQQILNLVNDFIAKESAQSLNSIQEEILKGTFNDKTYHDIAKENHVSESHIKDEGAKLWQNLSKIFGKKVSKKNFRSILNNLTNSNSSSTIINLLYQDHFTINNINLFLEKEQSLQKLAKKKL